MVVLSNENEAQTQDNSKTPAITYKPSTCMQRLVSELDSCLTLQLHVSLIAGIFLKKFVFLASPKTRVVTVHPPYRNLGPKIKVLLGRRRGRVLLLDRGSCSIEPCKRNCRPFVFFDNSIQICTGCPRISRGFVQSYGGLGSQPARLARVLESHVNKIASIFFTQAI